MRKSAQSSQPDPADSSAASTPKNTIQVGIDWADKEHAFSALLPSGKIKTGSFKQSKTGIEEWIAELSKLAPDCNIDVCIETSSGALINALRSIAWFVVFNAPTEATLFQGVTTGTTFEFTFFAEELYAPNPVVVRSSEVQ